MGKFKCPECGEELDEIHENTNEYAIYKYNELTNKYTYEYSEHPDYTEFYCPECQSDITNDDFMVV